MGGFASRERVLPPPEAASLSEGKALVAPAAQLEASRSTRSFELPTAPPYDWGRVYTAATNMAEHLRGVLLTLSTIVRPTKAGFDVLAKTQKKRALEIGSSISFLRTGERVDRKSVARDSVHPQSVDPQR